MKKTLFALTLCLILLPPAGASGVSETKGEAGGLELQTLQEVEVTTTKERDDIKKLPLSTSIVGTQTLERTAALSLKDFSSRIPNLYMPRYGSRLTSPLYIRGVGSRINAPSVGLYVDQVPYFEKSVFDFDLFDVESIEVLRGPQGTLYGRNTMGGLVHVISKSPEKHQGTRLSLSGGNHDYLKSGVSHSAQVAEGLYVGVAAHYHHTGGLFTNAFNGAPVDEAQSAGGRLRSVWQVSERWKLQQMSTFEYSDEGGYPYALYQKQTGVLSPVNYDAPSSYRRQMISNALVAEHTPGPFTLLLTTSFQYFDDRQAIDQDFTPNRLVFATQEQRQTMWSQEVLAKSVPGSRYQWLGGFFAFAQQADNLVRVHYREDAAVLRKAPGAEDRMSYDSPTTGAALFHQSTLKDLFWKGLDVNAGVRLDYEKSRLDYQALSISETGTVTAAPAVDSDLEFFRFVPRLVLSFAPNKNRMFYFSVTQGYKTGGFNVTFEREEDQSFDPENSWNYELGAKLTLVENKLLAEASLFYIDWKNQQIYQPLPSGRGSMLKNAGKSESKGLEFSLRALPIRQLSTYLNYGYTRAVYRENRRSETQDYAGKYIPYVPRQTLSAGVDLNLGVLKSVLQSVTLSLEYQGAGDIYWTESNDVRQPYYGVWNSRITARAGDITLDLWVRNLLEKQYHAFYFEAIGNGYVQRGLPLLCGVNLALNL